MSLNFDISVRGVAEAADDIERVGKRALHARPVMVKILALLLAAEEKLWARSGGKKWAPLADSTLERKEGDSGTLVRSGHLKASLTQATAEDAIREVTESFMDFGTRDHVARFHQAGSKDGRLPKREVLVFRPTDKRTARELIARHLLGEIE